MGQGPENRTTFGWDLTYVCNYRCPYCTVWDQPTPIKDMDVAAWRKIWDRFYELYGECYIYMSGGEPSAHRCFFELVDMLSKKHIVDICTNLSWDVGRLADAIPPGRLRIAATFHPSQVLFREYVEKAVRIKEYLPLRPEGPTVYYVAYPAQIPEMEEHARLFRERGLALVPLPYVGHENALGNSADEKEKIRAISPNKGDPLKKLEFQLKELSPKGRLCRAGQKYAMIRGDGSVDRCSQYRAHQMGDIRDANFQLWDSPRPCTLAWCPYESQWLVREETRS
ncbi:MAG TPA: radical SAM protein [Elusimicrobiota bacterium]|nr:radical SAM protein [Elusimicrobiota bacterium]